MRIRAELRVGLNVDLEHAAELVELVDVGRAEIARERREHLVCRQMQRLGLDAVDLDVELRHGRRGTAMDALQSIWIALRDHRAVIACSLPRSKLLSRSSICIVKPAALPMPWIGGGGSTRMRASSIAAILSFSAVEQRAQILALAALAPVLEHDVGDAGIGKAALLSSARNARDGDDCVDAGRLAAISLTWSSAFCVRSSEAPSGNCTVAIR